MNVDNSSSSFISQYYAQKSSNLLKTATEQMQRRINATSASQNAAVATATQSTGASTSDPQICNLISNDTLAKMFSPEIVAQNVARIKQEAAYRSLTADQRADYDAKKAYDAKPASQKYSGNLSVKQLMEKWVSTGDATEQEQNFIYTTAEGRKSNLSLRVGIQNGMRTVSNDVTNVLAKNGITLNKDEKLNIKVDSYYDVTISGLKDKDKQKKISDLLNDKHNREAFLVVTKLGDVGEYSMPGEDQRRYGSSHDGAIVGRFHAAVISLAQDFPTSNISLKDLSLDKDGNIKGLPKNIEDYLSKYKNTEKYDTNEIGWSYNNTDIQTTTIENSRLINNIKVAIKYRDANGGKPITSTDLYYTFTSRGNPPEGAVIPLKGHGLDVASSDYKAVKDPWNYDSFGIKTNDIKSYY